MKRGKGLIVLALIVAMVCFTSCSGDIRKTFSNMMGGLSGNIYEQMNLATPSTAAAASVVASVSTPATTTTTGDTTTVGGVSVTVTAGTTLVAGASEETINNLSEALNSNDTSANQVKAALKKSVTEEATKTAVNNTRTLANDALTALESNAAVPAAVKEVLKTITIPTITENMTQNDVLQTQLLRSMVETVATVATKDGKTDADYVEALGKVSAIVQMSGSLGGSIITADTISSLLAAATSSSGGKSVLEPLPDDFSKYAEMTNSICKSLFGLMKLDKDAEGNYSITQANWDLFVNNLYGTKNMMELALSTVPAIEKDLNVTQKKSINFALTDIVPYILGSVIYESQQIYSSTDTLAVVNDFLKNNKKVVEGTLAVGDQIKFSDTDLTSETTMKTKVKTYLDKDSGKAKERWTAVVTTVKSFNRVAGSSEFDKYFAKSGDDSLYSKIDDMYTKLSDWANDK